MRLSGKKKSAPVRALYKNNVNRFAPLKSRARNRLSGSRGALLYNSTMTNAASAQAPNTRAPITFWKRCADDGETSRHQQCSANSLHRPCENQLAHIGRQTAPD